MKKILTFGFLVLVLMVSGSACSKKGQGINPMSPDGGLEGAATPTQVAGTAKATPTAATKTTGKATAHPTAVQKSAGEQYIEANKPAKSYPYIVDKVDIAGGKITKVYLKPEPPSGKTVDDQDIRWSDRLAVSLYNAGLLKTAVSKDPTWREILNATIWVARGGLWVGTKDAKVDINSYTGSVLIPSNLRTAEAWVELVYYANFNRESKTLANILSQLGITLADLPKPEKGYETAEDLKKVVPGIFDLAKARGWGG